MHKPFNRPFLAPVRLGAAPDHSVHQAGLPAPPDIPSPSREETKLAEADREKAAREKAAREEANHREVIRREAIRAEAIREAAHREAARQEAVRKESEKLPVPVYEPTDSLFQPIVPEKIVIPPKIERAQQRSDLGGPPVRVKLSNRIHILGFDTNARFLAHAVASIPGASVNILAHHPSVATHWGLEHRRITLYNHADNPVSSFPIPCPQLVPEARFKDPPRPSDMLDNVIVSTSTLAVLLHSLYHLRDRIDQRTTLVLMTPGLGLVEKLRAEIFTEPLRQPNFVLGHSTYKVSKLSDRLFSVKEKLPGTLYLHGIKKFNGSRHDSESIAHEGLRQTQHLMELLSAAKTLYVVGLPMTRFLPWKLTDLIFSSLADTLSVAMGCRYSAIPPNPHAWHMWNQLLEETLRIVARLPEMTVRPFHTARFLQRTFRQELRSRLHAAPNATSPWINIARLGEMLPIDLFNGYLIGRAQELGLDHSFNTMALSMAKARVVTRRRELFLKYEGINPRVMESDLLGPQRLRPAKPAAPPP